MDYKQQAQQYFDDGFDVLPEFINSGASIKGWNTIEITQEVIDKNKFETVGIRLTDKIIAIDVDTHDAEIQHQIRDILPEGAPEKIGSKGFTLFFETDTPLKSENFKKNHELIIELLSTGRKTSIGIHRKTGKPYQWVKPLKRAYLPKLTQEHLEAIRKAFPKPVYKEPKNYAIDYTPDVKEVERALTFISNQDRDIWVAIGRALYSFDSTLFGLYDSWSSSCSTYSQRDTRIVWDSFNGTSSTTIATLFWHAGQGGYVAPEPIEEDPIPHCPMFDDISAGDTLHNKEYDFTPPPSLLRDISTWITDTSQRRQPILSVSAAIAFVGMLLAHKVQSPTGLRSNIYTVSIAHSGTGKDHPRKCVTKLMRYAGMSSSLAEKPTSGTAIDNSLTLGGAKVLYQIDEFGKFYQNIVSAGGQQSFMAEIKSNLLSVFSEANGVHIGKSFSSGAGKPIPPVEVVNPCLCIHGSTVPDEFYNALSSGDAVDGFLNRILFFISDDVDPEEQEIISYEIDDHIKNRIDAITDKYPPNIFDSTEVETVRYSDESLPIFKHFKYKANENRKAAITNKDGTAEAWVRANEIAIKLAMLCSAGEDEISHQAAQWGCDLSYWNSQQLVDIATNKIYDSEHHKNLNKVLDHIKRRGKITRKDLMNQSIGRKLGRLVVDELCKNLIITGDISLTNKDGEPLQGNQMGYYNYLK